MLHLLVMFAFSPARLSRQLVHLRSQLSRRPQRGPLESFVGGFLDGLLAPQEDAVSEGPKVAADELLAALGRVAKVGDGGVPNSF